MRNIGFVAACALVLSAGFGQSATVDMLYGDIDGFGGRVTPGAVGQYTASQFDRRKANDPLNTDVWLFAQNGGIAASPVSIDFNYVSPANMLSATLSFMESGMGDAAGKWSILFNGHLLGLVQAGAPFSTALKSYAIDLAWLTGHDTMTMTYSNPVSTFEGYAIDYVKLSVETFSPSLAAVPLPAGILLLGTALGGFGLLRRRKTKTLSV